MNPVRVVLMPECANGYCPSGCSHQCWECDMCGSSGGFTANRELLTELAAAHAAEHQPSR